MAASPKTVRQTKGVPFDATRREAQKIVTASGRFPGAHNGHVCARCELCGVIRMRRKEIGKTGGSSDGTGRRDA
jgi:hypothetical protein